MSAFRSIGIEREACGATGRLRRWASRKPSWEMQMTRLMNRWEISAGGREKLRLARVAVPRPGPGELLIRVSAVSLNSRDLLLLDSGAYTQFALPFIPGSEMAG